MRQKRNNNFDIYIYNALVSSVENTLPINASTSTSNINKTLGICLLCSNQHHVFINEDIHVFGIEHTHVASAIHSKTIRTFALSLMLDTTLHKRRQNCVIYALDAVLLALKYA